MEELGAKQQNAIVRLKAQQISAFKIWQQLLHGRKIVIAPRSRHLW